MGPIKMDSQSEILIYKFTSGQQALPLGQVKETLYSKPSDILRTAIQMGWDNVHVFLGNNMGLRTKLLQTYPNEVQDIENAGGTHGNPAGQDPAPDVPDASISSH